MTNLGLYWAGVVVQLVEYLSCNKVIALQAQGPEFQSPEPMFNASYCGSCL